MGAKVLCTISPAGFIVTHLTMNLLEAGIRSNPVVLVYPYDQLSYTAAISKTHRFPFWSSFVQMRCISDYFG